jgi:hypothetical protein
MRTMLLLTLLAGGPAIAQQAYRERPPLRPVCQSPMTEIAPSVAICTDSSTLPSGELRSAVFALPYWERLRIEQREFQMRFGLHPLGGLAIGSFESVEAVALNRGARGSHSTSERSAAERYAGLHWERESFLLPGDSIRVNAASEVQLVARQMGLFQSPEQAEVLALLGWRSRLQVNWQLGEPEQRIQWQLVSRLDRRRDEANEMIRLQATRRF